MGIEIAGQTIDFCLSVLLGALLCAVYDTERLIRGRAAGKFITAVLDLLFWGFAALALVWFSMTALGGELRLFAVLGACIGGVLWYLMLSRPFMSAGHVLISDFLYILRQIARPFVFAAGGARRVCGKMRKTCKNYFKLLRKHSMIKKRNIAFSHRKRIARRRKYGEVEKNKPSF